MTPDAQAPYAAALAGLPGMGPATLIAVLSRWAPEEAWARIAAGSPAGPRLTGRPSRPLPLGEAIGPGDRAGPDDRSVAAARRLDPPVWWRRAASAGIEVTWWGQDSFPVALRDDPQPPAVLFWRGSLETLDRPCVAIVGTRRASPDGRAVAFELGHDLAAAGVCVVSGLAIGIDGAAHAGALAGWAPVRPVRPGGAEAGRVAAPATAPLPAAQPQTPDRFDGAAPPIGVAASGVDVPYPRRHAALWERVAQAGAVLSETLPGRPPEAWRFPARNRIIAGLVRMVVIVESHIKGGSLITADAAIARGIDVRVVPGPVHSPACAGSNQLLYDGPGPVRDARDVLDSLGILLPDRGAARRPAPSGPPGLSGTSADRPRQARSEPAVASRAVDEGRPDPGPAQPSAPAKGLGSAALSRQARSVVDAVGWRPASLNQVVRRSGLPVPTTMSLLDQLEAAGVLSRQGDWWVRNR